MEIKHEGTGVKLTFLTNYSHKWTKPYSLYKYKRPDLQKKFVIVHHVLFVRI
jgi:hypothetical protein